MAQIPFRLNLSAANFPFISNWMGRSVIISKYDQNAAPFQSFSGNDADKDVGIPQIYYCHNVMPAGQGFRSVGFDQPVSVGVADTFVKVFFAVDPDDRQGIVAVSLSGKFYIYTADSPVWTVASIGNVTIDKVTVAFAGGYTYVGVSGKGIYKISLSTKTLKAVQPAGLNIVASNFVGICSSNSYLIAYDKNTLYWSSATDPEDFVPSLVTGAGSGIPTNLVGSIIGAFPLALGFAVYTSQNIILSAYSGNIRYPWVFRQCPNGAGISDPEQVTHSLDLAFHYVWSSSGLIKVTLQGAESVFGELSDFLAGRIFEDFDTVTNTLTTQYLTAHLKIKLNFVGSRFLMVSYGLTDLLSHVLVYDSTLQRWGKLKIEHVDSFEYPFLMSDNLPYTDLNGTTYGQLTGILYNQLTSAPTPKNTAPEAKTNIAFISPDGKISVIAWDYGKLNHDAVMILGKYQLTRNTVCTLHEIEVENIAEDNDANFEVYDLPSLSGKNLEPAQKFKSIQDGLARTYNGRITALSHSILFKGAFNIVNAQLKVSSAGRR